MMRQSRFDYTRFGIEPPFPWLGIGFGVVLGLGIAVVAPMLLFQLRDTNLLAIR